MVRRLVSLGTTAAVVAVAVGSFSLLACGDADDPPSEDEQEFEDPAYRSPDTAEPAAQSNLEQHDDGERSTESGTAATEPQTPGSDQVGIVFADSQDSGWISQYWKRAQPIRAGAAP